MMNEQKIKDIADECFSCIPDHHELRKFAELMVIEFTETVKQTATRISQTGFNDGLSMEEVNK